MAILTNPVSGDLKAISRRRLEGTVGRGENSAGLGGSESSKAAAVRQQGRPASWSAQVAAEADDRDNGQRRPGERGARARGSLW